MIYDLADLLVTNIQRMSFQDGPGLRTTVFLKGCNLKCPWCANPENISSSVEWYNIDGEKGIYGKKYSSYEIVEELLKDRLFWGDDGGVTFSGGEPFLQSQGLYKVLKLLKESGVNIVLESALGVPTEFVSLVLPYVDYVIADIKILTEDTSRHVLGLNIENYKNNVDLIYKNGKLKNFRMPCCYEYTLTESNTHEIMNFVSRYKDVPMELFKLHSLAEKKYKSLGKEIWKFVDVTDRDLENWKRKLIEIGVSASIIRL